MMTNTNDENILPKWAPRVPQRKIRRFYENDAKGIYDDEFIDDVGWSLLVRCQSFIAAQEAVEGKIFCPHCNNKISRQGRCRSDYKDELLHCDKCGWELTWGEYFKTIQHKQLYGAEPVIRLFKDFINAFPSAQTAREKVLSIDKLIHGFHWYYKDNHPTRPVAINLIEGRMREVIAFLDSITYGEKSTPETKENMDEWNKNIQTSREWYKNK